MFNIQQGTPKCRQWRSSGVLFVNFERISRLFPCTEFYLNVMDSIFWICYFLSVSLLLRYLVQWCRFRRSYKLIWNLAENSRRIVKYRKSFRSHSNQCPEIQPKVTSCQGHLRLDLTTILFKKISRITKFSIVLNVTFFRKQTLA